MATKTGVKSSSEKIQPDSILLGLNDPQKEAVFHGDGPLLIVAGAGTGKTTVLVRRIAQLIHSKAARPSEILALTFTDKAAIEMEERVDRLLPYGFADVAIFTFHAFGDRVLRENAFDLGFPPNFRVISQAESVIFLREHLFEYPLKKLIPLSDPTQFISALLRTFSRAKDEEVTPQEFVQLSQKKIKSAQSPEEQEKAEKQLEVALSYNTYEKLKNQNGLIDFGDQVVKTLNLFRTHADVLAAYQRKYKYILVDEFQDTNFAQFDIVKLLANLHKNVTVVGDDDQSIYKFRGACLSNILSFRETYPQAREIVLIDNYRSRQIILDSAYKLIQHNNPDRLEARDQLNKKLRSVHSSPKRAEKSLQHIHFETRDEETDWIAETITQKIKEENHDPKDFAILVRANADAEPYTRSLSFVGTPWTFSGGASLYDTEEIRLLLAFLRALADPDDSPSLFHWASSRFFQFNPEDLVRLSATAHRARRSLWQTIKDWQNVPESLSLHQKSQESIKKLTESLRHYMEISNKMKTGHVLYLFLKESGWLEQLARAENPLDHERAQNLARFFGQVRRFSEISSYDHTARFVEHIESLRTAGEDPSAAGLDMEMNAVRVLTVHAAKGLEFPIVFLAGLEENHFPSIRRRDTLELPPELAKDILPSGDYHLQEERRLFYVGMTRAKDELTLTSARDLGRKKLWKASRFVLEALDQPRMTTRTASSSPLKVLERFSPPETMVPPSSQSTSPSQINMNVTAVDDYNSCPLKYKYARILKIPVMVHHSLVLGTAIHEALRIYHLARKEKRKIALKEILKSFKAVWKNEGFVSREHEDRRYKEGQKMLARYFKQEEKNPILPALVEEDFKATLSGVKLVGRWDRVDQTKEGTEIIDIKTSNVKDQKEAMRKARGSTQLGLYALAYQDKFGEIPQRLSLKFVATNLEGYINPEGIWLEKSLEQLKKAHAGICAGNFDPTPGFQCRFCPYESICPALRKGR